jgi:hypothetical protein
MACPAAGTAMAFMAPAERLPTEIALTEQTRKVKTLRF